MDCNQEYTVDRKTNKWSYRPLLLSIGLSIGLLIFTVFFNPQRLASHMMVHILLMSILSPLIIYSLGNICQTRFISVSTLNLWCATGLQIVLLYWWHTPVGMHWAMQTPVWMLGLQLSLFLSSCWFWIQIFGSKNKHPWHSVFALLVTGKLFCLLALLITFSPRVLYGMHSHAESQLALSDQQLAGSIMILICPMTYIASAVYLISRWLLSLYDLKGSANNELQ